MLAKAAITSGDGTLAIEEIEVHPSKGDEVLVKMMASGLCKADHNFLH